MPEAPTMPAELPAALRADLDRAGYYPELVADVVDVAVAGEPVASHLVQVETTFDQDAVRRHVTVLVLTPTRLIVAHADDHPADPTGPEAVVPAQGEPEPFATAATEAVPLSAVRSVVVNHVVPRPETYRPGAGARDLTLTIGWGAVARLDLEPAGCADPECEADHGYTGTATSDDLSVRVSADAEGDGAVRAALDFARRLSAASAAGRAG